MTLELDGRDCEEESCCLVPPSFLKPTFGKELNSPSLRSRRRKESEELVEMDERLSVLATDKGVRGELEGGFERWSHKKREFAEEGGGAC